MGHTDPHQGHDVVVRQVVMDHPPVFAVADQAGHPEKAQMVRDRGGPPVVVPTPKGRVAVSEGEGR